MGVTGGCGTSTVSLAVLDAASAALSQGSYLLDLADPARSGLVLAGSREETLPATSAHTGTASLMRSWRGPSALVRAGADAAGGGCAHAASPGQWLRSAAAAPMSVVDLGHDVWPILRRPDHPLRSWLRAPSITHLLLVAPATRPGLRSTEAVFHQLRAFYDAHTRHGWGRPGLSLALNGAEADHHEQLLQSCSAELHGLLTSAVRVPVVDSVIFDGLQEDPLEQGLLAAGRAVLVAADVIAAPPPTPHRRRFLLPARSRT